MALQIVMANLKEQEKWEDGVYQIEENDPVLGGENGITNKPIKQLANRTLWLKKALELFGKKSAPKDLTAESTSTADESGHSHKLPIGSTTQKGIWQATSDTGIDSDGLVLTAKAGKKLAQSIAQLQLNVTQNYINNNKKSDAVNSNSSEDIASSKAVKTAYDKGVAANNNAEGRVSKSGDRLTGILYSVGISSKHFGYGAYANQYTSGAPFMVETTGSQDRDTYHPFVKGLVRSKGRYGAGFSFGYTTKQGAGDGFGRGIINLIEDNGTSKNWGFEHNGDFYSAGDIRTSSGKSLNTAVQLSDYRSQWGQTGWVKLPNGLILQWGKTPVIHDENSTDIVFPIAFPNKVLNIQLTENQMRTVAAHATHLAALNVTNSKFTFKINSTLPIDSSADWFAIGY
nr:MAG TPA: Putative tail fiber protein fold, Tail fiber, receptor [Caudoviricetes sp.]